MAIDDSMEDAISEALEATVDTANATLPMPAQALSGSWAWSGTTTVTSTDTSEVAVDTFIRLDSDGTWYKITSVTVDTEVEVDDVYGVGSYPSGSTQSSKARVDPPTPVGGTGNMDIFASAIADAFAATPHELPSTTVGGLPSASPAGRLVYVSNATGGAMPAFSDGSDWRRVTDRTVVT